MSGRLYRLFLFFITGSLCFLVACDIEHHPPLRFGSNVWPGYEPIYMARELGYFERHDVQLIEYTSASQVLRGFRNGDIDAAGLTLDEALSLLHGEYPKLVLVMDISQGGDVILADPDIRNLADIRGKHVGVESSALGAYMLTRALQTVELDIRDVRIVPIPVNKHLHAYKNDQVDVIVTFEPVRSQLLATGAIELFSSRQIPDEIVDVMVVRESFLQDYPEQVRILIDAWYKALEYLANNPQPAAAIISRRMQIPVDDVLVAYNGLVLPDSTQSLQLLGGEGQGRTLYATSQQLYQVMQQSNLAINGLQPLDLFIDKQKLQSIYP